MGDKFCNIQGVLIPPSKFFFIILEDFLITAMR